MIKSIIYAELNDSDIYNLFVNHKLFSFSLENSFEKSILLLRGNGYIDNLEKFNEFENDCQSLLLVTNDDQFIDTRYCWNFEENKCLLYFADYDKIKDSMKITNIHKIYENIRFENNLHKWYKSHYSDIYQIDY